MFPILVIAISFGVLAWAAHYISPQDQLEKADAIVAVSGGDSKARSDEAVELYKAGWAPQLIFSGAAADPSSESNAQAMANIAIAKGVDEADIALDEVSKNTKENAQEVSNIIKERNHEKVILVTSPYHQRRAFLEFRARLSEDISIINYPAHDNWWSRNKWWFTPQGWYLTITETPKTLWAEFYMKFLR
ncbi:MAG: YdcF family protein [Candidatus Saccharimonadales bacterium]